MAKNLTWDQAADRIYETGVRRGVLYNKVLAADSDGVLGGYGNGVAWNGLTAVTESPSGAEETPLYADDIKFLSLRSAEEFGATIEAYTYPDEWMVCDGTAELGGLKGVVVGQQSRSQFGLCYRTVVGNNESGEKYGYKIHLIYAATASPSERAYQTINDSPEAITFSWEMTTTPVPVSDITKGSVKTEYKSTACLTIDTTKLDSSTKEHLAVLESVLYGTYKPSESATAEDARLPLPDEVYAILNTGTPTYSAA